MKPFLQILILLLVSTFLNANNEEALYKEAQLFEKNGKYKEAMQIYKKLAKKKTTNKVYLDDNYKQQELKVISKTINTIEDSETVETIEQILASSFNLFPYHENYLLPFSFDTKTRSDRKQLEAKFQISVKKPLIHNLFKLDETIYFGYTHTSWWQIYDDSSPFRETNYRPEFFVTIPYGKKDKTSLKGFKFGFLHESNGRSEPESRSWNRIYLESYFQVENLFAIPRFWYRIPENTKDDDNPNIQDFMGYGDLTLVYPYKKHTFKLLLRNNLKFNDKNKGFVEFDWTFPFFNSKDTFGYFQISNGYGDSLIDYNKDISRISFGISISR